MDEFNDLLSKHELSEEQLTLCRDIRRRGKKQGIKSDDLGEKCYLLWKNLFLFNKRSELMNNEIDNAMPTFFIHI